MASYKLPEDMNFTDMAIYFDEHINDDDSERDDDLLLQFTYHWMYMIACKKKWFNKDWDTIDRYALWSAYKIYKRALNRTEDGKSSIRSLKNYCNFVASRFKVDFLKEEFNQILDEKYNKGFSADSFKNALAENIQDSYNRDLWSWVVDGLEKLPIFVRQAVMETPYKSKPIIVERLYISVLLTISSGFTLTVGTINKLKEKDKTVNLSEDKYIKSIVRERENSLVLWRLPSYYSNYVIFLCNKVRKLLVQEIYDVKSSFTISDDDMNMILATAYEGNEVSEDY